MLNTSQSTKRQIMQPTDEIRNYVEKMTLVLEQSGLTRTAGRVLSYLLICSPKEQSMQDFIDDLGMSKSSISTSTQTLVQLKLIERISIPGERRDYYRIVPNVWNMLMIGQIEQTKQLKDIAAEGIQLIDKNSTDGESNRLKEMYEFYEFWEQELPLLLERWKAKKELIGEK